MVFSGRPQAHRLGSTNSRGGRPTTSIVVSVVLVTYAVGACGDGGRSDVSSPLPVASEATRAEGLFGDATGGRPATAPQVVRQRFVTIDDARLIDDGTPSNTREYVLNLFPDVSYVAVVTGVERAADSVMWSGTLAGVELSNFSIVHTGGVFMVHVSSPVGIYEVTVAGDGIYRVDEIDQAKFPAGGG